MLSRSSFYLVILISIGLASPSIASSPQIKAFQNPGDYTWPVPVGVDEVDVLVVGGEGGGGGSGGGGGGAGGLIYRENYPVSSEAKIGVGKGGTAGTGQDTAAGDGEASEFGDLKAVGGGGGGTRRIDSGHDGGSGGGGNKQDFNAGGFGVSGQGKDGGDGKNYAACGAAGGGGGAGEQGQDQQGPGIAGDGGDGLYFGDIFGDGYGENGWFAGGGGGSLEGPTGSECNDDPGKGGKGGGGDGSPGSSGGIDGLAGTGGGGGGGNQGQKRSNKDLYRQGGKGGSGVVIIRYAEPGPSICDREGSRGQCISNSAQDTSGQNFNLESIFISEPSSSFTSLVGTSSMDVENSTFISGSWKGSFRINSSSGKNVIEAETSFRPKNGKIVIE